MEQIMQNFENFLMRCHKSKSTVDNTVPHVRHFFQSRGLTDPSLVTSQMIADYFAEIKPGYSWAKCNQANWALRTFFKWAKINGLEFPKQKHILKKVRQAITENELINILGPAVDTISRNSLEIKALLYFLFYTGTTKEDILLIRRENFTLELNELILINPKCNIQRRVPLAQPLVNLLRKYFNTSSEVPLPVKDGKEPQEPNAFNTSISRMNKVFAALNILEVLGEGRVIDADVFKNSFALHCLKKGIDLWTIQELVKHKNIKTTAGYIKMMSNESKSRFLKLID